MRKKEVDNPSPGHRDRPTVIGASQPKNSTICDSRHPGGGITDGDSIAEQNIVRMLRLAYTGNDRYVDVTW